jgi:hypothetical protein
MNMEKAHISSYSELLSGITLLKEEKRKQEDHLKRSITEFTESLSPLSIIKGSMKKLAGNSEVQSDVATMGLHIGARFLIDQVFGGRMSVKGFLGSMLANNISSSLIDKGAPKIISAIGKLLHRKPGEQDDTNTTAQ